MNRLRGATRAVGVAAVLIAAAVAVRGQDAPVIVPVEQEPHHRPVFRNDVLAVIDVNLPPGYTSLFHRHSNDNVSVRIATAPTRTDTLTGTGLPQTAPVGRLAFNSATPPYVHRLTNLGSGPVHIIDIEVLARTAVPPAAATDELAGHEVVVENARVRLSRVVLAPGDSRPAHRHPLGWLEVVVRGEAPGSYRWHASGTAADPVTAGPAGAEIAEIAIK